jgi:BirA family biotin operon repressor/biotin-[acetyl-CoA-carboxylase] ligase
MYIEETHSTSSLLRESYTNDLPHLFTIRADYQTAGRGQAGNSWESERGKNLLFSTLLRYIDIPANKQWDLSMLVAIATRETIAKVVRLQGDDEISEKIEIKWPNDIYFKNKKLAGILIENILSGSRIVYTIAGIGININQTQWLSNAPNPISIKQITSKEYNPQDILEAFKKAILYWEKQSSEKIREEYLKHLYRKTGWHLYVEREVDSTPTNILRQSTDTKEIFEAQWVDITPQGEWVLRLHNGEEKKYHFKQIRFVL